MPGVPPRKPSGNGSDARFQQWVYDQQTRETRLGQVDGHRVINSTNGKLIIPSGGRSRGSGTSVATFKLRFVEDDYLVCREWDGTTIGSTDIYVLKPYKLRESLTSEKVWGAGPSFVDYNYTYALDTSEPDMEYGTTVPDSDPPVNEWGESSADYDPGGPLNSLKLSRVRSVEASGITEDQRVIPVWLKGDIIYGLETDDGGLTTTGYITEAGHAIEYLMIGEARMWSRI